MTLDHLHDLHKIIAEIAVELLTLDKTYRYRELIYGDPENGEAVRATMHLVMALIAYGFDPQEDELTYPADWFDKPFPKERNDRVNPAEMNRLMVLLHLRPHNRYVTTRLEQLAKQYSSGYFDIQPNYQEFDTLWTLEALCQAKQAGVLDEERIISVARIEERLDQLITSRDLKRDKDIALALRLQYQMFGHLSEAHKAKLFELIKMAEDNGGFWGLREMTYYIPQLEWYKLLTSERKLTYANIQDEPERFRKVIVSTCMVIENLVPLMGAFPDVRPAVARAVDLWSKQFQDEDVVNTLRELFPRPFDYDYLLVLARTLRAFRAFIGQRLLAMENTYLLRRVLQLRPLVQESQETRNLKAALRSWIHVDLDGNVKRLRLGFSDSNLVRVHPHIISPLANQDEAEQSLIPYSLVIKYGPVNEVEKERINYDKLPVAIRDSFVRIPEASYVDRDAQIAYVVMEDLRSYKTLYELHEAMAHNMSSIALQLGSFLQTMHSGGTLQRVQAPSSLLRDIYLSRILEYIDRVFNFLSDHQLYAPDNTADIDDIKYNLFHCIGYIIQQQHQLERFPAAIMHGDLHMRNIMVLKPGNGDNSAHNLRFKLIDLEFLRTDGDAAFDAGELLVDIELVSQEERQFDGQEDLHQLKTALEESYRGFSSQRSDHNFNVRVDLAKARALLRIAKGKTKRGQQHIDANQIGLAQQLSEEIISHAQSALDYLRCVENALR